MRKNNKSKLSSYLIIVISIALVAYSFIKQNDITNRENSIPQEVEKQVALKLGESTNRISEHPDFSSLDSLEKLTLQKNFESWTPREQKDPLKIVKTIIVDKGSLAKGYVYIKASIDGKALTQWESVYMTMNYKGGHLFRPQSLPMPKGDVTELLFALNDIPYLFTVPYSEQLIPVRTDWFNLFGNNIKIPVEVFISSLKKARIEELAIYYSCEENGDCSLIEEK